MDCIQVDYIGLVGVNQGNNGDKMGAGKVTMGFAQARQEGKERIRSVASRGEAGKSRKHI